MEIIMDDTHTGGWTRGRHYEDFCLVAGRKLKNPSVYDTTRDSNKNLVSIGFTFYDDNFDECIVDIPVSKLVQNESVKDLIKKYWKK